MTTGLSAIYFLIGSMLATCLYFFFRNKQTKQPFLTSIISPEKTQGKFSDFFPEKEQVEIYFSALQSDNRSKISALYHQLFNHSQTDKKIIVTRDSAGGIIADIQVVKVDRRSGEKVVTESEITPESDETLLINVLDKLIENENVQIVGEGFVILNSTKNRKNQTVLEVLLKTINQDNTSSSDKIKIIKKILDEERITVSESFTDILTNWNNYILLIGIFTTSYHEGAEGNGHFYLSMIKDGPPIVTSDIRITICLSESELRMYKSGSCLSKFYKAVKYEEKNSYAILGKKSTTKQKSANLIEIEPIIIFN